MSEKAITGHVSQMRKNNKFLSAEDLMGLGEVEVEIETIFEFEGEAMQDGKKKDGNSIGFVGKKKRAIINATNRKTLVACFGERIENWHGKKIKLKASPGKRNPNGGAPVWGIDFIAKPDPELLKAKRSEMMGGEA